MKCIIYIDSLSSMFAIEKNRENTLILNQIYDILAEFHNQEKLITLCKVPAHIDIRGNEEADKSAKQAIDMPRITTTRLSHIDYYLTIRRSRNSRVEKGIGNSTLNYTLKNGKVPTITVGNTRLS